MVVCQVQRFLCCRYFRFQFCKNLTISLCCIQFVCIDGSSADCEQPSLGFHQSFYCLLVVHSTNYVGLPNVSSNHGTTPTTPHGCIYWVPSPTSSPNAVATCANVSPTIGTTCSSKCGECDSSSKCQSETYCNQEFKYGKGWQEQRWRQRGERWQRRKRVERGQVWQGWEKD